MKIPRKLLIRTSLAILVSLLVLLQVRLWVSEDGYAEVSRLNERVAVQSDENARFHERNQRLDAEVKDLKRGFGALEERARSDLGLVAPEESFYVIDDDAIAEQGAQSER